MRTETFASILISNAYFRINTASLKLNNLVTFVLLLWYPKGCIFLSLKATPELKNIVCFALLESLDSTAWRTHSLVPVPPPLLAGGQKPLLTSLSHPHLLFYSVLPPPNGQSSTCFERRAIPAPFLLENSSQECFLLCVDAKDEQTRFKSFLFFRTRIFIFDFEMSLCSSQSIRTPQMTF